MARHFSEFGDIERTRVLNNRGIAFITFAHLANAEFAKEGVHILPIPTVFADAYSDGAPVAGSRRGAECEVGDGGPQSRSAEEGREED